MFIEVGKQVSVDDLNEGIIIQSGNDACVAMAEHLAGSTDSFASLMNSWAAKLGMNDSHFMNPHGLDAEGHYSTAHDMARLGQALIRDLPEEFKIYSQKSLRVQRHHPAQPQPPAVGSVPASGWRQDRPRQPGRLQPGLLRHQQPRACA